MLYLLAIVFPPLAVLLAGKPAQAVVNFFLTLLLWIPGVIHAWGVVSNRYADIRTDRIVRATRAQVPRPPLPGPIQPPRPPHDRPVA